MRDNVCNIRSIWRRIVLRDGSHEWEHYDLPDQLNAFPAIIMFSKFTTDCAKTTQKTMDTGLVEWDSSMPEFAVSTVLWV